MRRASKRCSAVLVAVLLAAGCAADAPRPLSAPASNRTERRAPGVIETHAAELPDPVRSGDSRDQLLLLRAPAATELARSAVRDFLRAVVAEAPERIEQLLAPQAFVDTANGRQPARSFWQTRIAQLDYTELRGQLLFRDADVQTFRAEDLTRLPGNRRLPLELGEDEIAVRVPIRVSWAGRTRLFGDELLFRLGARAASEERAGTQFEILEIAEDFRVP